MPFSAESWEVLIKILGVNIVLSGDNAVVIALASRSLPVHLRGKAIWLGAGGAVMLRLIFSFFIVELMAIPYLKLVGAALLLWIGVKMLIPEHEETGIGDDEGNGGAAGIWAAVKTIIVADAVMSLDNVIAIAAAAKGDILMIGVGLAISVPLIIYGSTLILKILIRYPVFVMLGAGLIGWIAGEIWLSDPAVAAWTGPQIARYGHGIDYGSAAAGALFVVVLGKLIARYVTAKRAAVAPAAKIAPVMERIVMKPQKILLPVDGSDNAARAVELVAGYAGSGLVGEVHLLNVQRPVSGDVSAFVGKKVLEGYHHDEGMKVLGPAEAVLKRAGVTVIGHIALGDPGEVIAQFCRDIGCDAIVMGTRGLGGAMGALLGSVATDVMARTGVPVTLVK